MIRFSLLLALVVSPMACAQQNIRQVDFKNFTYPLSGPLLGHNNLQWLGATARMNPKPPIQLHDGMDVDGRREVIVGGKRYVGFDSGFTLESVSYGDVNGDGEDEAIVDLKYHTGGTQNTDYVYIFTLKAGRPLLLGYCHTGDRAQSGLFKVYADQGKLAFELLDPKLAQADCCSTGLVVTRFAWRDEQFYISGPVTRRVLSPEEGSSGNK